MIRMDFARRACPALGACLLIVACGSPEIPTQEDARAAAQGATRGFVLSSFQMVIPPADPAACPDGFNLNSKQLEEKLGTSVGTDCDDPLAHPDPGFVTLETPGSLAGLDLDGRVSRRSEGGVCAHDDFSAPDGRPGIDHQLWRVVGCTRGYQKGDLIDDTGRTAIRSGGFTVLVEVSGLDDPVDDDAVEVRFFSSEDEPPAGAAGEILAGGSFEPHPDSRFHSATAAGRIRDGVLTTDPVDLRLEIEIQVIDSAYWIRDAVLELELAADGSGRGLVAGYWDIDSFYEMMGRHYLASLAARFLGYTCPGLYRALHELADGHPNPETGACTSLSSAWQVEAVPAFILHSEGQLAAK
jgi:hypothetical protein